MAQFLHPFPAFFVAKTWRNIRGAFDILPWPSAADGSAVPGSPAWRHVEDAIRKTMARFHFEEIRTPVLEEEGLIARGIGEATDIVAKEMFVVDRGSDRYALRPEMTAPVMRAWLQHRLEQRGGTQRLYYIGPCFRAERPQKGRYRQFHQFGCEIIGSDDPRADAEAIALMLAAYEAFGVTGSRLRINTLGLPEERRRYARALQAWLEPRRNELSETGRRRLEQNPLRLLDAKDERDRALLRGAPALIDFTGEQTRARHEEVQKILSDAGVDFEEDRMLVRGLDYYMHTAFELESPHLGAQSALAGGGRYDLLGAALGSDRPAPGVGFAAGMERLFLALDAQGLPLPEAGGPDVFLAAIGSEAQRWAFREAQRLRGQGVSASFDLKGRSMKAQMREAHRQGARYALIAGESELKAGVALLKNMDSGEQTQLPADAAPARILERLAEARAAEASVSPHSR